MLEFKFDTQLLIAGHDLNEDTISDYITENIKGDFCHAGRHPLAFRPHCVPGKPPGRPFRPCVLRLSGGGCSGADHPAAVSGRDVALRVE